MGSPERLATQRIEGPRSKSRRPDVIHARRKVGAQFGSSRRSRSARRCRFSVEPGPASCASTVKAAVLLVVGKGRLKTALIPHPPAVS